MTLSLPQGSIPLPARLCQSCVVCWRIPGELGPQTRLADLVAEEGAVDVTESALRSVQLPKSDAKCKPVRKGTQMCGFKVWTVFIRSIMTGSKLLHSHIARLALAALLYHFWGHVRHRALVHLADVGLGKVHLDGEAKVGHLGDDASHLTGATLEKNIASL